jgi:hypothetical protein
MAHYHKLLIEPAGAQSLSEYEYIVEEKDSKETPTMYIHGPYMVCNEVNRNKRIYLREEMEKEVDRYKNEMVNEKRAMGELNHPQGVEVDLKNACHLVTELSQDGDVFNGKSKVLSTPAGLIVQSLIKDGVTIGMSSRSLGKLEERTDGINEVHDLRLIAIDCVADPSYPKAFVNGILESKQYVLASDGRYEEIYNKFEEGIATLPGKDIENYLRDQVLDFINQIKTL